MGGVREAPERPLFGHLPRLRGQLPWADLGELPTPVERLDAITEALGRPEVELWEKRDDLTSSLYGGNKVRTLEVLLADARAAGASHVYSTGAYGSNHAAATKVHAPRLGLTMGAMLYPQPGSAAARVNLELILAGHPPILDLPHWSAFPYGWARLPLEARRRGERPYVMEPGGAVPLGALGYANAALEVAAQVGAGELPRPRVVVLPVGSNCTTAGLLLGFTLAERFAGLAAPTVVAVRVTPWPVTIRARILGLATRAGRLLADLAGDPTLAPSWSALGRHLRVDVRYLGPGYGFPTEAGRGALRLWELHTPHRLDTTYSGKAAAAVVDLVRNGARGPILYWSTKSSAPLPPPDPSALAEAPLRMRRWLASAS